MQKTATAKRKIILKCGQIVPDPNDPWQDDVLHRKESARFLRDFVLASSSEPTTIFLNGEWGAGKSFFLSRWCLELRNEGVEVVEFNAWQDDELEDPILALIGQLHRRLHNKPGYVRTVKEVAKRVGAVLMTGLDECNSFVEKRIGISAERFVKNWGSSLAQRVEAYSVLKNECVLLRERLLGLAETVMKKTKHPLVFVIDELDRCEPIFSVRLLERIKHYFDIPGIVFVLGVDRVQLGHTVHAAYGDIDIEGYLLRFADFDFTLSRPERTEFLAMLWDRHGIDSFCQRDVRKTNLGIRMGVAKAIFGELCKLHGLTLRQMESAFRYFVMILRSYELDEIYPSELAAVLAVLKVVNPGIVMAWAAAEAMAADVVDAVLPIDDVAEIPSAMGIIAAVYATQANEVASIAHAANIFVRICKEKNLRGDEIKIVIPRCLRKQKNDVLKRIIAKIEGLTNQLDSCKYSHKLLLKLVARIDFMQHDASVYSSMRDDIKSKKKISKCPIAFPPRI